MERGDIVDFLLLSPCDSDIDPTFEGFKDLERHRPSLLFWKRLFAYDWLKVVGENGFLEDKGLIKVLEVPQKSIIEVNSALKMVNFMFLTSFLLIFFICILDIQS